MFKVIIAGSRSFSNYELLKARVSFMLSNYDHSEVQIVSGGAIGADSLGERFAREYGISQKVFDAEWNKYGRAAGPIRNEKMARYADALIAFWDGVSAGTRSMISLAEDLGLKIKVFGF